MFTISVAIVSEVEGHDPRDVARVTAALQRQALRDFRGIWGVESTIDSFPVLDDVPVGYWPIIVRDDIGVSGAAGIHLDNNGQPFALVTMSDSWSLTASHELLEMLADPFGNRVVPGRSLKDGQGRVEFLVEVCDPSEADEFGYTVNGILVSDFYTPHFFDPVSAPGTRYSFTGAIDGPRVVLEGGYLSWHHPPTDHWWQQTWFSGDEAKFRDLGIFDASTGGSLRAWIDHNTDHPGIDEGLSPTAPVLRSAVDAGNDAIAAAEAKAQAWHRQIQGMLET